MYIAIAGNIGSGKSTLAKLIGDYLGWQTIQDVGQNSYIDDFYTDMHRWSFNIQMYFLGMRLNQIDQLIIGGENAIIDRTIYEDAEVFAKNLHLSGLLSSRDYQTYLNLYNFTATHLPQPDLLIYLKADTTTLINQIKKRGRSYELAIEPQYLKQLNELYEDWIKSYSGKLLVVDLEQEDFILDCGVKDNLLSKIKELL